MIEGVGLSQDNELHVGEGECNGLGLRVDADSDGSVGSRMKFRFFFLVASLRGQCALVQHDLLVTNAELQQTLALECDWYVWFILHHPSFFCHPVMLDFHPV